MDCLEVFYEIRVTVSEHFSVEVELDKLVESRATTEDGSVLSDVVFVLGED